MTIYIYSKPDRLRLVISDLFYNSFIDLGYRTRRVFSLNKLEPSKGDVVFAIQPQSLEIKRWTGVINIAYQMEQLPIEGITDDRLNKNLSRLSSCRSMYDHVFDYYREHVKQNPSFIYCPLGYHECLDFIDVFPRKSKWAAIFVGSVYSRRMNILRKLEQYFHVKWGAAWNENYYRQIRMAKINLNIHPTEIPTFANLRIIRAMANHTFVLSEPFNENPFHDLIDISNHKNIPNRIEHWLGREGKRKRIENQAYKYMRSEFRNEKMLKKALREAGVK